MVRMGKSGQTTACNYIRDHFCSPLPLVYCSTHLATTTPLHHYTTAPLHTHTHTHRTKCTSNKTSPTWKRAICRNCVSLICVLPATSQLSLSSIHNTACRRSVKLLCKMFHGCNAKSSSSTTIFNYTGKKHHLCTSNGLFIKL